MQKQIVNTHKLIETPLKPYGSPSWPPRVLVIIMSLPSRSPGLRLHYILLKDAAFAKIGLLLCSVSTVVCLHFIHNAIMGPESSDTSGLRDYDMLIKGESNVCQPHVRKSNINYTSVIMMWWRVKRILHYWPFVRRTVVSHHRRPALVICLLSH